jgi:hypothetical protein
MRALSFPWVAGAAVAVALSMALAGCAEKATSARPAGARGGALAEVKAKAAAPTAAPVERKLVPLDIKLPGHVFCSPFQAPVPETVEKPTWRPRPPFMAPVGTRNVALAKPLVASDYDPILGEIACVTDGDKEAGDGRYVELGPGRQWVQIDLGAEHKVYAVVFWLDHGGNYFFHDVVLQLADDPGFNTNVRTVFNNDHDNSSGLGAGRGREYFETHEGKLVDAGGARARYVRLYTNGSNVGEMNRYTEVDVYAGPASGGR